METRKERLEKIKAEKEAKMLQEMEKQLELESEIILQKSIPDCYNKIISFFMTNFYGAAEILFNDFDIIAKETFLSLATKSQCKPHFTFCDSFVLVTFEENNNKVKFFIPKDKLQIIGEIVNEMWLTSEEVQNLLLNLNAY